MNDKVITNPVEESTIHNITWPELLKFYYSFGFPIRLGSAAHGVATGIMFKANELFFRDSFAMANQELSSLSGVRISNIGTVRKRVLEEVVIDNEPFFFYESKGQGKAGIYSLNYEMLKRNLNQTYTKLKPNLKQTYIDSQICKDHNKQTNKQTNIIEESLSKIISFINEKILNAKDWVPDDAQNTSLETMITNHDMTKITNVIDKGVETGVQMSDLFDWLEKGLKHYDYFYNKPKHVAFNSDEAIDALKEKLRNGAMEKVFHLSQNDCETLREIGYRIRKQMPVYKPACRENEVALILHLIDEEAVLEGLQEAKTNKVRPAEAMDYVTERIIGTTMDKMEEERRNAGTPQ